MVFELAHVTNCILYAANKENIPVSPMKLQKILYFLYKEYWKIADDALFSERFEAWKYGPALMDVYQAFKQYGSKPIKSYYPDANGNLRMVKKGTASKFDIAFSRVWSLCKGMSGIELSQITHTKGSAWYQTYMSRERFIDDSLIKNEPNYLEQQYYGG